MAYEHYAITPLLQPDARSVHGPPLWRVHDLLHSEARRILRGPVEPPNATELPGLGYTPRDAHAALLDRYQARLVGAAWYLLPDDGYIHAHLAQHMEEAGRAGEVHALLAEETSDGRNGWYVARERLGQVAGYIADLARASRLVRRGAAPLASPRLALQCRYELMRGSVNSVAASLPPSLLCALVAHRLWPAVQGLAFARQIRDPSRRCASFIGLIPHVPVHERDRIGLEALAASRDIKEEPRRVEALKSLGSCTKELCIANEIWDAASGLENATARIVLLAHLARDLGTDARRRALAKEIEALRSALVASRDSEEVRFAGIFLLQYVDQDLEGRLAPQGLRVLLHDLELVDAQKLKGNWPEVAREGLRHQVRVASTIADDELKADVLATIAPYLTPKDGELAFRASLDSALRIFDELVRLEVLVRLVSLIGPEDRRRAIDRAFDALEQLPGLWISQRAAALEVLLSHAGPDRNAKMLNTVRALAGSINDITQRVTLLVAMAPYLETAERDRLLMEALEETRPIRDGAQRADVIITLANTLDAAGREQALRDAFVAARQTSGRARDNSLAILAVRLAEAGWGAGATLLTREIQDASLRSTAFWELVYGLIYDGRMAELTDAARDMPGSGQRNFMLSIVADCAAAAGRTAEALEAIQSISDVSVRRHDRCRARSTSRTRPGRKASPGFAGGGSRDDGSD